MRKIGKSAVYIGIIIALIFFALTCFIISSNAIFAYADELLIPEFRITEGTLSQVYGSYTPICGAFYGANNEKLTEDIIPTISFEGTYPKVKTYSLKVQFAGNRQYAATTKNLTLEIRPRPINVQITGSYDFTYDGLPHTRTWALDGAVQNEEPGLTVLYNNSEIAVDVGTYAITMRVSNPNYCVGAISGGAEMRINPCNLTVGVDSVIINEGETPQYKFRYSGFVTGEDEKVLTTLPRIEGTFTEPGIYQLVPTGAVSKNYNVTYAAGSLTVNRKLIVAEVADDLPGTKLEGAFSPSAYAVLSLGDRNSESFSRAKTKLLSGKLGSKLAIDAYYHLELSEDRVGDKFVVKLSDLKLSPLAFHHVAVVDEYGNLYRVDNSGYRRNTLTFLAPTDGEIIVYRDYTALICIVSVIVLLVLIVIAFRIAERYRYKRAKRRVENRQEKRKPKYIW